jgi:hypothetical protein
MVWGRSERGSGVLRGRLEDSKLFEPKFELRWIMEEETVERRSREDTWDGISF